MANELRLTLSVFSKRSDQAWFNDIKRAIHSEPTSVTRIGEKYFQGKIEKTSDESVVAYRSTSDNLDDIGFDIEKFIDSLKLSDQFEEATTNDYVQLGVVIYSHDANPGFHLTKKLLRLLSKYSIELDADIYFLDTDN